MNCVAKTFQCTLVTPESQVLEDQLVYASIPAWDGLMGIAPQHAPLVLKLGDGPLRLDYPEGESRWFFVGGGFAQMNDNKLSLLAREAAAALDVVPDQTQADLRQAEARAAKTEQELAQKRRDIQRARVLLDLARRHRGGA